MLGYVEEAAEECLELRGLEAIWDEVRVELATAIRATTGLEGLHIQPKILPRSLAMPAAKEALEKLGVMEERITELTRFVEGAVSTASGAEGMVKELHRELHPGGGHQYRHEDAAHHMLRGARCNDSTGMRFGRGQARWMHNRCTQRGL